MSHLININLIDYNLGEKIIDDLISQYTQNIKDECTKVREEIEGLFSSFNSGGYYTLEQDVIDIIFIFGSKIQFFVLSMKKEIKIQLEEKYKNENENIMKDDEMKKMYKNKMVEFTEEIQKLIEETKNIDSYKNKNIHDCNIF